MAEYVNACPITENLKLNIFFKNDHRIKLCESIDIHSAALRTPFTHLFNSSKRKELRGKIVEKQLQDKIRFTAIIKYIEEKTGIKGKRI